MPTKTAVALFAVLCFAPLGANATLIDPTTWGGCLGGTDSCTIGNATLSTDDRNFREKTVAGQRGLGIAGGRTNGEIDLDETLHVDYGVSEVIGGIRIVFIYNGPEFRDVAEIAEVTVNDGPAFTLSVSGTADDVATWSGTGSVSNCGSTVRGGSGCFDISDPFGNLSVTSLAFTALEGGLPLRGRGTNQSDFSIGAIHGVQVPEPGTLALLATGLLSVGLLRRRRAA